MRTSALDRPDAPLASAPFSTSVTRVPRAASAYAMLIPFTPPPITTTSEVAAIVIPPVCSSPPTIIGTMGRPQGALVGLLLLLATTAASAADGGPEYRRFFGGDARLAVWIAAQLHLMLGAFVLGVPIFGVLLEIAGWRSRDDRYDRLARELTSLLTTA